MNDLATLVGDGIENPANAEIMKHVAAMFGARCVFRDTKGLGADARISNAADLNGHAQIIACDNLPRARELFGFEAKKPFAAIVGNERRGVSHEFSSAATDVVEIPMQSRAVNCLNVAAASGVLLYYLSRPRVAPMAVRNDPGNRRPDVLFLSPRDHFEFGSTVRSAAAFGWSEVMVEDTHAAWFGCDRAVRAEGRAAARRGKNDILLIPSEPEAQHRYPRVTVITEESGGIPITRANLAGGSDQLIVIGDQVSTDWNRFGREVSFARLEIPAKTSECHLRVRATIALAEIARQVGRRAGKSGAMPRYRRELVAMPSTAAEFLSFEELMAY